MNRLCRDPANAKAASGAGQWHGMVVGAVETLRGDPKTLADDVAVVQADVTTITKALNAERKVIALGPNGSCSHAQTASDDATAVSNDSMQIFSDSDLVDQDAAGASGDSDTLTEDLQLMKDHHDGQPPSDTETVRAAALKAMKDAIRKTNKLIDTTNSDMTTATNLANGLADHGCRFDHIFAEPPLLHIGV